MQNRRRGRLPGSLAAVLLSRLRAQRSGSQSERRREGSVWSLRRRRRRNGADFPLERLRRAPFHRGKGAKARRGPRPPDPGERRPYVVRELPMRTAVAASAGLYGIQVQATHHAVAGIRFPKRRTWCQQWPQWLPACAPVAFWQRSRCCQSPGKPHYRRACQGQSLPFHKGTFRAAEASVPPTGETDASLRPE